MVGRHFNVLLTGFGPFLNFSSNPTTEIAQLLHGTCDIVDILPEPSERTFADMNPDSNEPSTRLEVCWHTHVLPVNRTGALWTVEHLRQIDGAGKRPPYDAVFHTGLEDYAKGLKLEVAAVNVQAKEEGSTGEQRAVPGAEYLLPTTVNTGWMSLRNLVINGPSARARRSHEIEFWSRDAGTYYCNEVYFRTLQHVRSQPVIASTGAILPVMFIHVQNATANSVRSDVDSVRQIVAHSLWATYIAPGSPQPPRLSAVTVLPSWAALLCFLLGGLSVGVSTGTLYHWRRQRHCHVGATSCLQEPLNPSLPSA